jgi:hypothetical protein
MQSIQLTTQVSADGFLQIEMPPEFKNLPLEVMLIFQVLPSPSPTDLTYPNGQFYGACAHDEIILDEEGIDPSLDEDLELTTGVTRS